MYLVSRTYLPTYVWHCTYTVYVVVVLNFILFAWKGEKWKETKRLTPFFIPWRVFWYVVLVAVFVVVVVVALCRRAHAARWSGDDDDVVYMISPRSTCVRVTNSWSGNVRGGVGVSDGVKLTRRQWHDFDWYLPESASHFTVWNFCIRHLVIFHVKFTEFRLKI